MTGAQTLPADLDNTGVVLLASGVEIREARRNGDGSFAVEIQTRPGHNYTLKRSADLSPTDWQTVAGQTVAGDRTVKTLSDSSAADNGRACYRIVVEP